MTQPLTLNRVGADVKIYSHPGADQYTIIGQTIDGKEENIFINNNEIDDLIDVLRQYRESIRD